MSPKPLLTNNIEDDISSETGLNMPTGSDKFSSKMLPGVDIDDASTTANKNKELNHPEVLIPKSPQSIVNYNNTIDTTNNIKPYIKPKDEPSLKLEGNGDAPMYSFGKWEKDALLNETSIKTECEWKKYTNKTD